MNVKLDIICKIDDNGALTSVRIERVFEQITGYESLQNCPASGCVIVTWATSSAGV